MMLSDHDLEDRFRALLGLVLLAAILVAASGCGGGAAAQHRRLNVMTAVADPTYEQVVQVCDDMRDLVVTREGTTEAEDRADMAQIVTICDTAVEGFEALRGTQLTAREALDHGLGAAATQAVQEALGLWPSIRQLAERLLGEEDP